MKDFTMQYWCRNKANGKLMEQAMRACLEAINKDSEKIILEVIYTEAEKKNEKATHEVWIDEVIE